MRSKNLNSALILALATTTTGCATMKSPLTWFKKDPVSTVQVVEKESSFASTLANTGRGLTGQVKSMGTAVSSAMGKAKTAVTSPFTAKSDTDDPTSLANMPKTLGPEIWVANGHLYESQGNTAKALENYSKALEVEPDNLSALLSTARLYANQGQSAQAIDFYDKAIAITPDAVTYNEMALQKQKIGKAAEAQVAIQKAIELEPGNVRYRNNLASLLVSSGRSDEAVKQLEQVLPQSVANYNVAYLHFSNRNMAAAQQHLQVALQQDPNLEPARELMNQLSNNQTGQTAVAAYQAASNIYRTAQATQSNVNPTATTVPYQTIAPNYSPAPAQSALPTMQSKPSAASPFSAQGLPTTGGY